MKLKNKFLIGIACLAGLSSCSDWLDVNTDPNNPNAETAPYYARLSWLQFYTTLPQGIMGRPVALLCGDITNNSTSNVAGKWAYWNMTENNSYGYVNPYQTFFVGARANFDDFFSQAEEAGAWHYLGAGYLIRAYGFMLMADCYGEMPYTEALQGVLNPKFDDGKTIFKGCIDDIDKAIEYLSKDQNPTAQTLAVNDIWMGGNTDTWLKAAYLLKARWLNHLSKKGEGSAADLKWDSAAILDCLAKAQQSNADNFICKHTDTPASYRDPLWNENVLYNPYYSVLGQNGNFFFTKATQDNFDNFGGYGVADPRGDKVMPWARSTKSATTPDGIKWSEDGNWRRSEGLDMNTLVRQNGAPYATSWNATEGRFYCNSESRSGDTIYVEQRSGSQSYFSTPGLLYYVDGKKGAGNLRSAISGTFATRASSWSFLATYAEACFIKAEVLFKLNRKDEAYTAYREGVKAHIEQVNDRVRQWNNEDWFRTSADAQALVSTCPSFTVIPQEEIDYFLDNGIGTAADITLAKIMTQKKIAVMFTMEEWNDMRRYNFDESIFLNWHRPAEYGVSGTAQSRIPAGKYPARVMPPRDERNYNVANLNALGGDNWWSVDDIWSLPVWWDTPAN